MPPSNNSRAFTGVCLPRTDLVVTPSTNESESRIWISPCRAPYRSVSIEALSSPKQTTIGHRRTLIYDTLLLQTKNWSFAEVMGCSEVHESNDFSAPSYSPFYKPVQEKCFVVPGFAELHAVSVTFNLTVSLKKNPIFEQNRKYCRATEVSRLRLQLVDRVSRIDPSGFSAAATSAVRSNRSVNSLRLSALYGNSHTHHYELFVDDNDLLVPESFEFRENFYQGGDTMSMI